MQARTRRQGEFAPHGAAALELHTVYIICQSLQLNEQVVH